MLPALPAPWPCPQHRGWMFWGWESRVMPAVPPLTSVSPQGCRTVGAGAVLQGKDLPSSSGKSYSWLPSLCWRHRGCSSPGCCSRDADPKEGDGRDAVTGML